MSLLLAALASCLSLSLASPVQRRASAQAYCTTSDLSYKLSSCNAPSSGSGNANGAQVWDLSIDDTSSGHKQSITGFGAAVTDATVTVFDQLSSGSLNTLINDLMTGSEANFALMRHTIAASDLSGDPPYTYDDNGGNVDTSLSGFNLGDRGNAMAKLLAQMKKANPGTTVLGSPWSAPGWMKINGKIDGDATDNNLSDQYLNNNQPDYSSEFAQYFVKYIQAYKNLGTSIDAITIQNEPLNSQAGYPTMYMYSYEAAKLIQNFVGPALSNAGLSTKIWAYDHNTDVPSFPQTVVNNAGQYVNTVAWHCYAASNDWSTLTTFHNQNPNVQQYMTECWTPATNSDNWWQAANFTLGPLQNWASGVIAWTLATNPNDGPHLNSGGCATCQGLITVNNDGSYTKNLQYYLMAQFSKFMPKGSTVLSGSGSSSPSARGVQSVAALNPNGGVSVAIMNTLTNDVFVRLSRKSGATWSGLVKASSMTTWVLPN